MPDINTILIYALVILALGAGLAGYLRRAGKKQNVEIDEFPTIGAVLDLVKSEVVELVREDYTVGLSDAEFDRMYRRKARINWALKQCVYGVDGAKIIVIDIIRGIITKRVPEETITRLLGLTEELEPSDHIKWEMLMYKYKRAYGRKALEKIITKYEWDVERPSTESGSNGLYSYYVTAAEFHDIFSLEFDAEGAFDWESEDPGAPLFDIRQQIDVLAVLIYQQYKGFGLLDTLREMDVNGFNVGTSGAILGVDNDKIQGDAKQSATNGVWVQFRGKYIHLRFMDFGSEEELRRIIQLLVRWGSPGPLTAKRGYLVNTMCDQSRIMAMRPPVAEYWSCFVRKFSLADNTPEGLIASPGVNKPELPLGLIKWMMRGEITQAYTGRQSAGKTTLMRAAVRYIDPRYTIRVLEMAPELYLRETYQTRNILSAVETQHVTATEVQDAFKKSDGAVSIAGEVATDEVAARMIQFAMTGSIFTFFSHHANTAKDLVLTLRNSLVNAGGFSNMQTAERQVVQAVRVDIHLDFDVAGQRFVDRVSEIVPLDEGIDYPDAYDPEDPASINKVTEEYYKRVTDRTSFTTHDIMRYDRISRAYYAVDRFSEDTETHIRSRLGAEDREEFDLFMLEHWGPREGTPEAELSPDALARTIVERREKLGATYSELHVLAGKKELALFSDMMVTDTEDARVEDDDISSLFVN
jgi:pilus assembly protein CpaF